MTVYEPELYELCKKMRLSRNLAERALEIDACDNLDSLVKLLLEELAYRDARRNEGLVKAAGFYSVQTLEGYVTDDIQFPIEEKGIAINNSRRVLWYT